MTGPPLQGLPGTGSQFRGGINGALYVQAANLALHGLSQNAIEQTLRASGWKFSNDPLRVSLRDIISAQTTARGVMRTAANFQVSRALFRVSERVGRKQYTVHLRTTFNAPRLNRPLGITLKFDHQPTAGEIRAVGAAGLEEARQAYEVEEEITFNTLEAYEAYRGVDT